MIYPDNKKRASRLQQLIDSAANMQTDIKTYNNKLGDQQSELRKLTEELLQKNKIDTIDQLLQKATAQMTAEDKARFEKMIESAKKLGHDADIVYFLGGVLFLPEGIILTGKALMSVGRFVLRIGGFQAVAGVVQAQQAGAEAAGQAAAALEKAATEVAGELAEEGGEVVGEISEAVSLASKAANVCKFLGLIGFVLTAVMMIIEAVEGAEQKEKLIEGIHAMQSARLCTRYFKEEAANIIAEIELLNTYLDAQNSSLDPTKSEEDRNDYAVTAKVMAKQIVKRITEQDAKLDMGKLGLSLDEQDRSSPVFFGDDDLPLVEVIKLATEKRQKANSGDNKR